MPHPASGGGRVGIATQIIDKLAFGGSGVCRMDGKVCFVPFSCPGDEVRLKVVTEKRSYLTAELADLAVPSPWRVEPCCPLFGRCGGCNWQHIAYEKQCAEKLQIHREALWRGARVEPAVVGEIMPSPQSYHYRSRVQLKLHAAREGLHIGFYRSGSHFVVDAPLGCPIAAPLINEVLLRLRQVLATFPEPAALPQIDIDCGDNGAVAVVHYIGNAPDSAATFFRLAFAELAPLSGILLQTGRKSTLRPICGTRVIRYGMPTGSGAVDLECAPGGFSQVNRPQNHTLLSLVRQMGAFSGRERLLDLYCGNGNFSIPLAHDVASVVGIEGYEESINAARENCRKNAVNNAEFRCDDVARGIGRLLTEKRPFDCVLLDPPRAGAAEAIDALAVLAPERIIYVSCDSSTLSRDCGLLAGQGYRVERSVPVDMFPQTYHLESVTLLAKYSREEQS